MSSRAWKWVFVGALIVLALYSAYPPMRVAVKQVQVVKRPAATQEEALEHGVAVGGMYEVSDETAEKFELVKKVAETPEEALAHDVAEGEEYEIRRKRVFKRLLPLALGERSEEVEVRERREDGTVVEVVTTDVAARIKLGRDLSSGSELLYEMKPQERESSGDEVEDKQTLEDISKDTIRTLRRRIDPQHIKEFSIQKMGANRILIQVPKASRAEVERLKARLVRMGLLEFRLAMPPPVPGGQQSYAEEYKQAWAGKPVPGYDRMMLPVGKGGGEDEKAEEARLLLVRAGEAAITGRLLAEVSRTPDKLGRPAVGFKFNREGRKTFATITDRNKGWLLAIILDGKLQSAPVIRERIAGSGIIEREGGFSKEEVDDLVTILHAGSLAVDLELLQESTVGPQLGRDSISRGLRSIAIAGFLVLAFIGVYYLSCGMVADGALILNLVLLTGVMGLLGAALTLPGVAGVLLTIGMAVDANVLIFERIREESAGGKPIHVALRNGYDRAYTTIIDANVTTLLTAVILYLVGTGPVKGFAVTLSAGIVLSMFTALFVTRLALETMLAGGWLRHFKMFSILGQPKLAYSRWRVRAYVASAVVIVVGLVAFGMRGSEIYDIDFKGGILMRLSLRKAPSTAQVRAVLAESGFPGAEVQALGSQGGDEGGSPSLHPTDFHVRIKRVGSEDVRRTLELRVQERLTAAGLAGEKAVKPTSDGRGLIVELNAPVDEMTLRRALAGEGGDPFGIDHIAEVFATGGEQGQRFTLRLAQAPVLAQARKVWADMLSVLQWGGMTRYKEAVTLGEITAGGATAFGQAAGGATASGQEEPGADASMELSTSKPISGEVLAVGVATFFPKITVQVPREPAETFTLNGPREALEQFKNLTAGELDLLPAVFDGWSVSVATGVSLPKPVPEDDLRGTAQSKGLGQVWIVGEDLTAQSYRLNLSYERVMQQMTEVFSELDERQVTVDFED
ncbi:MAG: protein translocase subunit SecD, partial [Candidatus Brocadiia bacterium]|nr:protein translocase subunit SecD [Candidatus Brocadiia bacterium]